MQKITLKIILILDFTKIIILYHDMFSLITSAVNFLFFCKNLFFLVTIIMNFVGKICASAFNHIDNFRSIKLYQKVPKYFQNLDYK